MKITIEPGSIKGTIAVPPSKSMTQRMLAAALLHSGATLIHGAGRSDDENAVLKIIQQLGAKVTQAGEALQVNSEGLRPATGVIDCGESGLAARLFLPIAATHHEPLEIVGKGTLTKRPMAGVKQALEQLGVKVTGNDVLPFTLTGPLHLPARIEVDAAGSSQFVSGLLMALSAVATHLAEVRVRNLESRPYIDMTLEVLSMFGKPVQHERYRNFVIDPATFTTIPQVEAKVEADWSSASCLLVAGAIAGDLTLKGLNPASLQADRKLLQILQECGAQIDVNADTIHVCRSRMQGFETDATNCPDLFPALAALASFCNGESNIRGVHRLFNKESNRVESITEMLWRYGVNFSVEDDTLTIDGRETVQWAYIDGFKDHRIVMASAVCALRAKGPTTITTAEAVSKSYPGFFEDMRKCGMVYRNLSPTLSEGEGGDI
ncbi:MAG: 3-phosphoshikimate 1-carboxyvinyltransferase [Taibaiella sp.]|nr:3-phosphoshikimate 1-carboxyvinyltransferase [Taibaiella sp.]